MPVARLSTVPLESPRPMPIMTEVQTKGMTHYNPYAQQILDKGRDLPTTPAPKAQYPRTIGGRVFATEADYKEALADFLNGM